MQVFIAPAFTKGEESVVRFLLISKGQMILLPSGKCSKSAMLNLKHSARLSCQNSRLEIWISIILCIHDKFLHDLGIFRH